MMIEKISTYRFRNFLSAKILADEFIEDQFFCQLENDGTQTLLHVFVEADDKEQPNPFLLFEKFASNTFFNGLAQSINSLS